MKVECENLSEREATPELIRELIRDDVRRGEFMILMQDADEESFVQIAGDYEDVGGEGPYALSLLFANHAEDEARPQALVVVSVAAHSEFCYDVRSW